MCSQGGSGIVQTGFLKMHLFSIIMDWFLEYSIHSFKSIAQLTMYADMKIQHRMEINIYISSFFFTHVMFEIIKKKYFRFLIMIPHFYLSFET